MKAHIVRFGATLVLVSASLVVIPGFASADPCLVPNVVNGTADLPPRGCEYLSPAEAKLLIAGLPSGTHINLAPIHKEFACACIVSNLPAGGTCPTPDAICADPDPIPGNPGNGPATEMFNSALELHLTGTGLLSALNCNVKMPAGVMVTTEDRPAGTTQTFATEMNYLGGQVTNPPSCPGIFQSLTIEAGDLLGLSASSGQTTLTLQPAGNWKVDSYFDVYYRISFVGASGGPLNGMSGTTTAATPIHMIAQDSPPVVPGMSPWGMTLAVLMLLGTAAWLFRRRMTVPGAMAS